VLLIGNNSSSITDASDTGHTLTPSGSISASSDVTTGNSFIVPTSPLTDITNTKILTCQNSTGSITDASSNNHTVTTNGNAGANALNPFSSGSPIDDDSSENVSLTVNGDAVADSLNPF
ncbi:MAG: hypothetical protein CBC57_05710, partial [Euryarchaeota archaeon TMED97]